MTKHLWEWTMTTKTKLKVITSEREYRKALKTIEGLWEARPDSEVHDTLEVLALLVDDYEKRTFPMEEPDPVAAIRFRLEQAQMEPKDLVPSLGSRSRVSEVLNHRDRPFDFGRPIPLSD